MNGEPPLEDSVSQGIKPAPLLKAPIFVDLSQKSASNEIAVAERTVAISADHRVPAWDGIRGLAILLVVIFHFSEIGMPRWLGPIGFVIYNFGWCGVDLFFVLSGFLITGILHDAKGSSNYFSAFYARRAVRIFPAYYALLVIMLLILPHTVPHLFERKDLPVYGPGWVYLLYVSNYCFAMGQDAFGSLGHTWSLAVEEQFYLIWPALVFFLSTKRMKQLCVMLIFGTIALRAFLLLRGFGEWPLYLMSITRFDELAMGGLVAVLMRSEVGIQKLRKTRWLAVAAPLLLAGLWVVKKHRPELGFVVENSIKFPLISTFFAVMLGISATTSQASLMNRALATRALRFFGKYSYGLYLYHVPVFLFIERHTGLPTNGWQMLLYYVTYSALTMTLALLSWNFIEKHALRLKRFFPVTKPNVPHRETVRDVTQLMPAN